MSHGCSLPTLSVAPRSQYEGRKGRARGLTIARVQPNQAQEDGEEDGEGYEGNRSSQDLARLRAVCRLHATSSFEIRQGKGEKYAQETRRKERRWLGMGWPLITHPLAKWIYCGRQQRPESDRIHRRLGPIKHPR